VVNAVVVKYRGSKVLEGASKGCGFFHDLVIDLKDGLVMKGYDNGNDSAIIFQPDKLVCRLTMQRDYFWGVLGERARLESSCPS